MTAICTISDRITVTGHTDGTINVWDTSSDKPLSKSWSGHSVEPYYMAANITKLLKIDNHTFASGAYDGHIKLWDIETGKCIQELQDSGYITGLQVRSNDQLVSSSVYNSDRSRAVRTWNYKTGSCTSVFIPDGKVLGVDAGAHWRYPANTTVLADQKIAFTTYNEAHGGRAIVVLDPDKQTHECYPVEHQQPIDGLAALPDGFATISSDLTLKKWPASICASTATFKVSHSGELRALNSQLVACVGTDKVSIYNMQNGQRIGYIEAKQAFFHDATGCNDVWIKLTDDSLFKINLPKFQKFYYNTNYLANDIHHYLFSNTDPAVRKAYIDCGLPQLTAMLKQENEDLQNNNKKLQTEKEELAMNLRDSKLAENNGLEQLKAEISGLKEQLQKLQVFDQTAELKKELERLKKSPLDVLLLEVAAKGDFEKVQHLLALDANLNAKNEQGQSVLLVTLMAGHRRLVDFLLTKNPDLNATDDNDNTVIDNMAIAGNIAMLALLIERHSKQEGIEFLERAYNKIKDLASNDHIAIRKLLSDCMLTTAIKQGKIADVAKACREYKADIDAQDSRHETALHKAAYLSHLNIVEYLLNLGANTSMTNDSNNQTAIQAASGDNRENIIKLIQHYELLRCILKGDKENLERLMGEYADLGLNQYADSGIKNLLVTAIISSNHPNQNNHSEIIKLLLSNGANPNVTAGTRTPLHAAVELDDKESIKLLIKAGALKDNKNRDGQTVIEYARVLHKSELADYMLERFAKEKVKAKHGIVSKSTFTKFGNSEPTPPETSSTPDDALKSTSTFK